MSSSQGDFGWTLAGEEAGGDGETGERFLLFLIFGEIVGGNYIWSIFLAKILVLPAGIGEKLQSCVCVGSTSFSESDLAREFEESLGRLDVTAVLLSEIPHLFDYRSCLWA